MLCGNSASSPRYEFLLAENPQARLKAPAALRVFRRYEMNPRGVCGISAATEATFRRSVPILA